RPDRRVRRRDAPRLRHEQDPRHDPHLSDAGRGEQVRRRRLEEGPCPAGVARLRRKVPRMDGRLGLLLFFFCGSVLAQGFDHSHKAWDGLLKKNVVLISGSKASQFRYAEMAKERAALKAYLDSLSAVKEQEFNAWSKNQRMAFL